MQYGFAIDQRTCIGCHACTVACKTEHEVPVGQFRTWVKYVDAGTYPDSSRHFGVMRCNHCTDAPCVTICPTGALFKRDDGIVDFDGSACIGCKSCLQACPYDALYIDADTHTAAKCNFCAHRIDSGLEPACVVVCPTESIWVGDLHDADSGISRFLAGHDSTTRAPEQGTGPNVHYVGADSRVLDPLAAPVDGTYIWATPDAHRLQVRDDAPPSVDPTARTTLSTAHAPAWGWRVWTYLWTKSVAAGAVLVAALLLLGDVDGGDVLAYAAPVVGAVFAAVTGALLVADLKRPERFWYLFTRPNPRSWLALGSLVLLAFGLVVVAWFGAAVADAGTALDVVAVLAVPVATLTAGYTAFLFWQAEGRDLWQSRWLFPSLVAQAVAAGAGALLLAAAVLDVPGVVGPTAVALALGLVAFLVVTAVELGGHHGTRGAQVAARIIVRGRYARAFWGLVVAPSAVLALASAATAAGGSVALAAAVGVLVQVPLLAHESLFVRAGQDVPLS